MTAVSIMVDYSSSINHFCQVCERQYHRDVDGGKLLRCARCKNAYYCSVDCQRHDWTKGRHRLSCLTKQEDRGGGREDSVAETQNDAFEATRSSSKKRITHRQAHEALKELCLIAHDTPVADSFKLARQAQDEMFKEREKLQTQTKQYDREQTIRNQQQRLKQQKQKQQEREQLVTSSSFHTDFLDVSKPPSSRAVLSPYVIEEMPRIQQYQLTLWVSSTIDTNNFSVSARKRTRSGTCTLITIRDRQQHHVNTDSIHNDVLFEGVFPRTIDVSRITCSIQHKSASPKRLMNGPSIGTSTKQQQQDLFETVIIRLPFAAETDGRIDGVAGANEIVDKGMIGRHSSLDDVNHLVCNTCQMPILLPNTDVPKITHEEKDSADDEDNELPSSSIPSKQAQSSSSRNSISMQSYKSAIKRIKLLPKGHWDEIADYLICYSGQPIIDFTIAGISAERSVALEDESTVGFHVDDVGLSACALAASDFHDIFNVDTTKEGTENNKLSFNVELHPSNGVKKDAKNPTAKDELTNEPTATIKGDSATVRGDRLWCDETGECGSINLFCSQCCSALGFSSLSSPETWRFWKHRLSVPVNENHSNPTFRRWSTCSSFLVREMVRYAESKAIFTFVIHEKHSGGTGIMSATSSVANRCLLLRLLSWETAMASSLQETVKSISQSFDGESESSNVLRFGKVAKIVFEETRDHLEQKYKGSDSNDVTTWVWGGVDLCCVPSTSLHLSNNRRQGQDQGLDQPTIPSVTTKMSHQTAVSTVRLGLPVEEYEEIKKVLEDGTVLFSDEVAKTTILLQMGESRRGLRLTALPL